MLCRADAGRGLHRFTASVCSAATGTPPTTESSWTESAASARPCHEDHEAAGGVAEASGSCAASCRRRVEIATYPVVQATTTAIEPELAATIPAADPPAAARIDHEISATSAAIDPTTSHLIPARSRAVSTADECSC